MHCCLHGKAIKKFCHGFAECNGHSKFFFCCLLFHVNNSAYIYIYIRNHNSTQYIRNHIYISQTINYVRNPQYITNHKFKVHKFNT